MIHLHGTQAVAFRVLVVDKDPIQRMVLARCVEMLGWQADTADNSGEAVDKFAGRRHNVVVIDLGMGQPATMRILRHLRRGHVDPSLIFVSGAADAIQADSLQSARDFGLRIAGILARPIDPYRLHALLLSNPQSPRSQKRLATSYPTAQELDQALRDG